VSLKSIGLLLGAINEFWNVSKKSTLMICVNEVSAAKGLAKEALSNNVADSGKSHIGEAPIRLSYRMSRERTSVAVRIGLVNA
jgi:hypothetical protein